MLKTILLAALLAATLTGCGGGDPDEPDTPTPRVDCQAKPKECS